MSQVLPASKGCFWVRSLSLAFYALQLPRHSHAHQASNVPKGNQLTIKTRNILKVFFFFISFYFVEDHLDFKTRQVDKWVGTKLPAPSFPICSERHP